MLIEHRIDDVSERLVGVEYAVATGKQIPFQPALALMLAEHLHHSALRRKNSSSGSVSATH